MPVKINNHKKVTTAELNDKLKAAVSNLNDHMYLQGVGEGLKIAKTIRNWLTRLPDRAWQKQVREWADKEITKAETTLAESSNNLGMR